MNKYSIFVLHIAYYYFIDNRGIVRIQLKFCHVHAAFLPYKLQALYFNTLPTLYC